MMEDKKKNFKDVYDTLPRWARILLAIIVATAIYKFVPIVEILTLFFWATLVPIVFLFLLGVISTETYDSICEGMANLKDAVKQKMAEENKSKDTQSGEKQTDDSNQDAQQ
jgi:uncharacterized protein YacL